jgi:hypothetical protein
MRRPRPTRVVEQVRDLQRDSVWSFNLCTWEVGIGVTKITILYCIVHKNCVCVCVCVCVEGIHLACGSSPMNSSSENLRFVNFSC